MLIDIRAEESNHVKETLVEKEVNPFEVIKGIWNPDNNQYENSIDHIDNLNHNIGAIRLSVRKMV